MIEKFKNFSKKFFSKKIDLIEKEKSPIWKYFLAFIFLVQLRLFLEMFSGGHNYFSFFSWLHQNIYFIDILLSWSILVYFFTRQNFFNILKVFIYFFSAILIVPIVDLLYYRDGVFQISYIYEKHLEYGSIMERFFTFGGKFFDNGISLGLKMAATTLILLIFFYIFLKTKSFLKAFFGSFLAYFILFLNAILPFLIPYSFESFDKDFALFFGLLFIFQTLIIFYILKKEEFLAVFKEFSIIRILNYFLIFLFGAVLFERSNFFLFFEKFGDLFLICLSFLFAGFFATANNNIEDFEIDKITNKNRALVAGKISLKDYKFWMWSCLFFAIFISFFVGSWFFMFLSFLVFSYFVYSSPPFRFRKNWFFSKFILAFNFIATIIAGNFFIEEHIYFNFWLLFFLFIIFFLYLNFIDLKDYVGDKKNGVKNLVVIWGMEKAKKKISHFFCLAFLLSNLFIWNFYFFVLSVLFSFLQYFFLKEKKYNEKKVFYTYTFFLVLFILAFVFWSDIDFDYLKWEKVF